MEQAFGVGYRPDWGTSVVALLECRASTAGANALHDGLAVTVAVAATAGAGFYAVVAAKMRKDEGLYQ